MRRGSYPGLGCRVALFYCISTLAGVCQSPQVQPEIRFRLVHDTLIVLSFEVNQQGPFDFVLDTGINTTIVDSSLASELLLVPLGHVLQISAGGRQTLDRSLIGTLALGHAQVENCPALIEDLAGLRKIDARIQGIVGQDFLSHFNYLLDYRRRSIRMELGNEIRNAIEDEPVPMELKGGKMMVETESRSGRSEKLHFVLDSGATSIMLTREGSQRLRLPIRENRWELTCAGQVAVHAGSIQLLTVGLEQFHDVRAALSNLSAEQFADGLLPTSLFQGLYINNRRSFVVFNPRIKGGSHFQ